MSEDEYRKLSQQEIELEVGKIHGWKVVDGKLKRTFEFENFVQAFGFMTQVAIEAERLTTIRNGLMFTIGLRLIS